MEPENDGKFLLNFRGVQEKTVFFRSGIMATVRRERFVMYILRHWQLESLQLFAATN